MKKYRPVLTLFLVLILPLLVYGLLKLVSTQKYRPIETISEKIPNPGGSPDSVFQTIGNFSLLTQTGEPFSRDSMRNRIWVCSLFFTRCGEDCDKINTHISKLQSDYRDNPTVCFLSITVDPTYDTLSLIQSYANRVEAQAHRWYFLTGNSEQISKLITTDLQYPAIAPEDVDRHLLRESGLRLVDWNGRMRGAFYNGLMEDEVVRMAQHLLLLEKELDDTLAFRAKHP